MLPATTVVTAAETKQAVGFWSFLSLYSSSVKSRYIFSLSIKVIPWLPMYGNGVLNTWDYGTLLSVTDDCTFLPGLPRSGGTSHILSGSNQVLPRLSSSVEVFTVKRGQGVVFVPAV